MPSHIPYFRQFLIISILSTSQLAAADESNPGQSDNEQNETESSENSNDTHSSDETNDEERKMDVQEPQEATPVDQLNAESTTANDKAAVDPETKSEAVKGAPIQFNPEEAESLDKTLTKEQIKWLEPTRGKLPQNPYQHVDFTAYTLEWGEFQAGLNRSSLGVLPRTQLGTQIPLWALGIQNANLKVNALRMGPVDLAITGDYLRLSPVDEASLSIGYYGIGGYGSFRVLDNWSIHAGGQYATLNISGMPDFTALSGPIKTFTGLTDDDIIEITNAIDESVDYARSEQILSARIASDIRLNRRDSFIVQGNMMRSTTSDSGLSVEAEGIGLDLESDQISSPLFQYLLVPEKSSVNYGASIAYQASFKRAYLRLGVGYSTIPYAWLLQSVDLTWRWGGQTKRRANELEKIWELNKKLNKQGADSK